MPERNDAVNGTEADGNGSGYIGRRRMLQLAGVTTVGAAASTGVASASSGADRLEIVTPENESVEYEFVTTAEPAKVFGDGDNSAEPNNDSITGNDDGTWTVTGLTGNGYGDAFDLRGDVTSFSPTSGEFTLYLNGTEVTVDELVTDPGVETSTHMLEIVTPENGSVEYSFTTAGKIEKVLDDGDNAAEPKNDSVTENGDDTWTVTGRTGNGYGDTVTFEGEPIEFAANGEFTLYLDGQETTVGDLTGQEVSTNRLEILTPENGSVEYSFTTGSEIRKDLDNGDDSAEPNNDSVTENGDGTWSATGLTGNGYGDTYEFAGQPQAFSPKEGEFSLHLNGQQVTAYELVGEEPPNADTADGSGDDASGDDGGSTDGAAMGGGSRYARTVTRSDANIVARTASELVDGLSAASAGEVVFVPGDEQIDLGGRKIEVPAGVTLASNRGVNGAPGALLYTDQEVNDSLFVRENARFTGLQVRGPHPGSDTSSGGSNANAIRCTGDCEIDNNDVWGFSLCAVAVQYGSRAHVHHNVIRENNRDGLGYGVWVDAADPIIEYNFFHHNRHSVAESSDPGSYTCRYNHFSPTEVLHNIDMHAPCGDRYDVHNNVVETVRREWDGNVNHIVSVRDAPNDMALIQDNWFFNPNAPDSNGPTDRAGQAIIQPKSSSWTNVSFSGNHYGEDANVTYSDVIPNYDGWRT